jgi:hypothetical protein
MVMSTISSHSLRKQPDTVKTTAPAKTRKKKGASYRYSFRDMPIKLPNGERDIKRIPLTLDDVLHPKPGDVHVLSDAHGDDCTFRNVPGSSRSACGWG